MIMNIGLTGLMFFILMMAAPKILGNDVPYWLKAVIIVPGVVGFCAMLGSMIASIWVN